MRYQEESSGELGELAAKQWRYRYDPVDDPERVLLTGPCPECQDVFEYDWPLTVVRADVAPEPASDASWLTIPVICRCRVEHPGAEGEKGCGRSWTLTVPAR